jgi:two-component system sensor histidine kinase SenX3
MRASARARLSEQGRALSLEVERTARLRTDLGRVQEALDLLPLGITIHDEAGREVAGNRRALNFTGDRAVDALVARALEEVMVAVDRDGPVSRGLELRGPPPRSVQISASRLSTGGIVTVLEDTSERRHLDAVRRDFVANVNHELRTPIGALTLLADALAEETELETVQRLAGRISAEAGRAQTLIDELIDLSRVESNQHPSDVRLELTSVMEAATRRVLALSELRQVAVTTTIEHPDLAVNGSKDQLVSALVNLLDNAIKYSDPESTVEVRACASGDWAVIEVSDHGIGIPAKDLDRVFERFYRVDRARDRRTGGSGLGLAIVRHAVANHGGEVTVVSREGDGSTFTLRLPRAR